VTEEANGMFSPKNRPWLWGMLVLAFLALGLLFWAFHYRTFLWAKCAI